MTHQLSGIKSAMARCVKAVMARRRTVLVRLGFARFFRELDALRAEIAAVGAELQAERRRAIELEIERDKLLHSLERLISGDGRSAGDGAGR
jgi:hypothetical protein